MLSRGERSEGVKGRGGSIIISLIFFAVGRADEIRGYIPYESRGFGIVDGWMDGFLML